MLRSGAGEAEAVPPATTLTVTAVAAASAASLFIICYLPCPFAASVISRPARRLAQATTQGRADLGLEGPQGLQEGHAQVDQGSIHAVGAPGVTGGPGGDLLFEQLLRTLR